jgi:hypothetical protein
MPDAFTLALDVVDEAGRPIEGARVEVIDNNTTAGCCGWPYHDTDLATDPEGRVTIAGLEAERDPGWRYFLSIQHPSYAEGMLDRPERLPREDGVAPARLALAAGHALEGRLDTPRAAEGSLTVSLIDPVIPGCHAVCRFATLSADGTFRVTGLHPGRHTLHAKAPGAASLVREVMVPDGGPLTLALPAGRRASGQVIGDSGAPLEGAEVLAEWDTSYGHRETTTDASGMFSLDGLPAGERVVIAARRNEPIRAEALGLAILPPGEGDVDLTFDARRRGTLRGRVHDDRTGEPFSREVEVRAEPADTLVLFRGAGEAADGRFSISLPEGEHTLVFEVLGEEDMVASATLRHVVVTPGELRDDLRVDAAAAFRVEVHVIDAVTLAPVEGAAVVGRPENVWYRVYLRSTEPGGILVVEPAIEGPLQLRVDAAGYKRATTGWIEVRRGRDPIVVKLERL